jgi:hypothetical protein
VAAGRLTLALGTMDDAEAMAVLEHYLERYRAQSYLDLATLIQAGPETAEVVGPSGVKYQLEIIGLWDDKPNGVLRIRGAIDDGGLRAYVPLVNDFLIAPDGSFVDE